MIRHPRPAKDIVLRSIQSIAFLSADEVLRQIDSTPRGLRVEAAALRAAAYGPNTLQVHRELSVLGKLLKNLLNPLTVILLVISALSFFLGERINASIILTMVVLSVSLNFFQEHRASTASKKLQSKIATKSAVWRDGKVVEIPTEELTIGDVLELNAGDLISADARLLESKDLYTNQASLTGESFPVEKHASRKALSTQLPTEYEHSVFAGTHVVSGTGRALVISIGKNTQFGAIAHTLSSSTPPNDFTKGVQDFSATIVRIILIFVVSIFCLNVIGGHDWLLALLFAVSVAVGLTPEFLPMVMAVTMSRGSVNMSRQGVIVKRLTAIPTIGSMTILCADKTGTLTEDHIRLVKYVNYKGEDSEEVFLHAYINSAYQTGISNPMDTAVLEYKKTSLKDYRKIDEIPFDFERKRMSVVVSKKGTHVLVTKGAPEEIIHHTTFVHTDSGVRARTPFLEEKLFAQYHQLSAGGYRVLAVAVREFATEKKQNEYTKEDETQLTFLGFVAFLDPARKGVRQSIDELADLGVEMKVITGDNELVTRKICENADIPIRGLLLGHQMDAFNDSALYARVMKTTIFARCSPLQKERIIRVLREHKQVVGYLGDGINDAPSLKAADVGISVSNGVPVAKESSDIILTHKSLHELKKGVIEGRKTFTNTMKYIQMGLSSNFGNMFSVLGAVLFLPFLPMLPIQILLNNFLYDVSQLTLPFDQVDKEAIAQPTRWDMREIRKFMFTFGPISSFFDFCTYALLFFLYQHSPAGFQTGWFMESLATQTLVIYMIRTRKTAILQSKPSRWLVFSTLSAVAVGWIVPSLPVGGYFGFTPLPASVIAMLAGIVLVYLLSVEVGKKVFYAKKRPR